MFIEVDDSIAGWNHIETLIELGEIASTVPENGWIMEIGSYSGRGSFPLAANKLPSVRLSCVDLFPDAPTLPDQNAFGHVEVHHNGFSFNKNIVEKFDNVEMMNAETPICGKFVVTTQGIDVLYFNNSFDPDKWKEQIIYLMEYLSPNAKVVVHNLHLLRDAIEEVFGDDYNKSYRNLLCIVEKK